MKDNNNIFFFFDNFKTFMETKLVCTLYYYEFYYTPWIPINIFGPTHWE